MGAPPPRRSASSGRGGGAVGLLGLLRPISGDISVVAWLEVVSFLDWKGNQTASNTLIYL